MGRMNFGRVSPTFIVIGVQKGGTTSLHRYLLQHPKLISPKEKELHYFDTSPEVQKKSYKNRFPIRFFRNYMSFESTPRYMYFPSSAERIHNFDPNIKFIVVLRDPVDRAFSAWNMYRQLSLNPKKVKEAMIHDTINKEGKLYTYFYKNEFPSFEKWIKFEIEELAKTDILEPSIVRRGYYKDQIENYLKYFKIDQFHFIDSEDLKHDTISVLNSIAGFLGISNFYSIEIDLTKAHVRAYEKTIDDDVMEWLRNHYIEMNEGLEGLINKKLAWLH